MRHEDFQLSFLTNAANIYDDYVHFLVELGDSEAALRWADYSRARALAEGLGLLPKAPRHVNLETAPDLKSRDIARRTECKTVFMWHGAALSQVVSYE